MNGATNPGGKAKGTVDVFHLPGLLVRLNRKSLVEGRKPLESCWILQSVVGLAIDWNLEIKCTKVLISWLNLTTEIFRSKSWQGPHFRNEVTSFLGGSQSVPFCPDTANFSSDHHKFSQLTKLVLTIYSVRWTELNFNDCRCNLIQRAWVRDNVRGGIDVKVFSHTLITC